MSKTYSGSGVAGGVLLVWGFLALCLGSGAYAGEIPASLIQNVVGDRAEASELTDLDDAVALQDLYDFGDLGAPPGFPGSTPVGPAYQRELDLAVSASRAPAQGAALNVSFPQPRRP
jgi:hypothetical protein